MFISELPSALVLGKDASNEYAFADAARDLRQGTSGMGLGTWITLCETLGQIA